MLETQSISLALSIHLTHSSGGFMARFTVLLSVERPSLAFGKKAAESTAKVACLWPHSHASVSVYSTSHPLFLRLPIWLLWRITADYLLVFSYPDFLPFREGITTFLYSLLVFEIII